MQHTHTHTHTRLTALFPGLPRWAGTRKGKLIWILLKHETVSGSSISWAMCKSAPRSRQITTPAPHHSVFCRPDALPAAEPTASKHWKQVMQHRWDKWQEDDECSLCGPPSSPRDCQILNIIRTISTEARTSVLSSDKCESRMVQTVSHTVNECPASKLHDGGLQRLHYTDDVAINWLEGIALKHTPHTHTHTHTHLTALFPGLAGWAGTRKVKPI